MKVSVAINNYNYSQYIIECVESVLNQTYKDFEIIIVDDGSTDNSLELLYSHYANNQNIKIITKHNGGQLSAFNETVKHITGEVVFFLDADDLYKKNYIESVLKIYDTHQDIDFVFCALEKFFPDGTTSIQSRFNTSQNLGFSTITTFIHRDWIGNETSAISMKTNFLKKVLPIPLEQDWITRADDCLVWGASVAGGRKYFLNESLVKYRVHGGNHFYNNNITADQSYKYTRILTVEKLFSYFKARYNMPLYLTESEHLNDTAANLLRYEYLSKEFKTYKLLKKYIRMLWHSKLPLKRKYRNMKKIILRRGLS